MTQVTAKKSYIKDADGSYVVPYVNPADNTNLGVVKPDGTTITVTDGIISTNNKNMLAIAAYASNGELLTDPEGLADITNYAHSTFDLSKFTVVGSPNITDDGIASGFSSSNYLIISTGVTLSKNTYFKIYTRFKTPATFTKNGRFFGRSTNLNFGHTLAGKISGTFLGVGLPTSSLEALSTDTVYDAILIYDSTGFYIKYKAEAESTYTSTTPVEVTSDSTVELAGDIGNQANDSTAYFTGSIDLKQFSITVDGVEVFSGNKTGIDTIKPDDYTAPSGGSLPTISADGIASGFGNNVCIAKSLDFSSAKTWEIQIPFRTASSLVSDSKRVFDRNTAGASNYILVQVLNNLCRINLTVAGSQIVYATDSTTFSIATNTNYIVKIGYDGTQYYCKYSTNGGEFINVKAPVESSTLWSGAQTHYIGYGAVADQYFNGSIDLNAFKIYVNGDLVYQPCLKIPYTWSKTGSKIVDSIYRDRVNDMASQFGFAPYYTLSDTDFTLPQVELYGLIGAKTLRDSYENGINKWYLYSNRDLEQQGSCTSGVEVTLPKPFADTNYILTVPYSAKSATAFTPTQTGDWYAKGKGIL